MSVKICDMKTFQQRLNRWCGGAASFNVYKDDHDRLTLKLSDPLAQQEPVGLVLFYCTYISGPTSWASANLMVREALRDDGSPGYKVSDAAAHFFVCCGSASLYGDEEAILPERR